MIRLAALTVVLVLAGTPVATATCLLWCCGGAPCSQSPHRDGVTISPNHMSCEGLLVSTPSLREETRRERSAPSQAHLTELPLQASLFDPDYRALTSSVLHEHAPPGHPKPPTVLRL